MPEQDQREYHVSGTMTISIMTRVMAKSLDEAIGLAYERQVQQLCNACAIGDQWSEWVTSGELDGEPTDVAAVECK